MSLHLTRRPVPQNNRLDIAIVGGGIAGLYCAYQLALENKCRVDNHQKPLEFLVFEASDHLGGRIWSTRYTKDAGFSKGKFRCDANELLEFCAEFGPMRIEREQQVVLKKLLDNLGVRDFEQFPMYGSPTSKHDPKYELKGQEKQQKTPIDLLRFGFVRILGRYLRVAKPRDEGRPNATDEAAMRHLRSLLGPVNEYWRAAEAGKDWKEDFTNWLKELDEPEYQSIRKYGVFADRAPLWQMGFWNLLSEVLSHHAVMKVRDLGSFYHLIGANPNAAEWLIFWLRALKTSEKMEGIKGGMQCIARALVRSVGRKNLRPNHKLIGVAPEGKKIRLTFENIANDFTAMNVILALPKAPLEKLITASNCFPRAICGDVDGVFGFPLLKLFFVVKEAFWTEPDYIRTNQYATLIPAREVHYRKSRLTEKGSRKGMILVYTDRPASAFWANYVQKTGAQNEPEFGTAETNPVLVKRIQSYLEEYGAKDDESKVLQYGIRDWGREPYLGAAHAWRPERKPWELMSRLSAFALNSRGRRKSTQGIKNVHVCGEAYSDYQGFMEGALRSAAHILHTIFKKKLAKRNPFESFTPWLCACPLCRRRLGEIRQKWIGNSSEKKPLAQGASAA